MQAEVDRLEVDFGRIRPSRALRLARLYATGLRALLPSGHRTVDRIAIESLGAAAAGDVRELDEFDARGSDQLRAVLEDAAEQVSALAERHSGIPNWLATTHVLRALERQAAGTGAADTVTSEFLSSRRSQPPTAQLRTVGQDIATLVDIVSECRLSDFERAGELLFDGLGTCPNLRLAAWRAGEDLVAARRMGTEAVRAFACERRTDRLPWREVQVVKLFLQALGAEMRVLFASSERGCA